MHRLHSIEYKWIVAMVFVTGLFMDLLDTTIVNVALRPLPRHLAHPGSHHPTRTSNG